jgi:hypothetical protein
MASFKVLRDWNNAVVQAIGMGKNNVQLIVNYCDELIEKKALSKGMCSTNEYVTQVLFRLKKIGRIRHEGKNNWKIP